MPEEWKEIGPLNPSDTGSNSVNVSIEEPITRDRDESTRAWGRSSLSRRVLSRLNNFASVHAFTSVHAVQFDKTVAMAAIGSRSRSGSWG